MNQTIGRAVDPLAMNETIGRGANPLEAAKRADEAAWDRAYFSNHQRAAIEAKDAVAKAIDPNEDANRELERGAAAESAVRVVMAQLGLQHPTRISVWTMREITRLLDSFYQAPEGEIKLGGQTLGSGFVREKTGKATP